MKITPANLPEVLILEPRVFGDARGFFTESWNEQVFNKAVGQEVRFVQDSHSRSVRGVLRGLHYQMAPHTQGKLVRVVKGLVFDVVVDMRRSSPNFGRWAGVELSEDNHRQVWVPPGFAHGFLVLSESADFLYKTTHFYAPQSEASVRWDDPAIGIQWPDVGGAPLLAEKDAKAPLLAEAKTFD
ncbi:dTDP-4-dehydrorhamnose 3,5-epimerase [Paucibacter sp. KBW04]|uniref:dTDP-4-dehydrorhamnose 3,5-epimerase n=1 Tax=Paucibacter sp. KBW04 TaxID=2153361 RepID=UPI000F572EF2|nr:dTDP-4-dehydrorhamnose 3,5-epimerase [Paucibacter sp. KBW04]RQO62335.1 dTDP-4-dehydrorhamnose 3,5-epimerase [Paucibacter sp. KBW04]